MATADMASFPTMEPWSGLEVPKGAQSVSVPSFGLRESSSSDILFSLKWGMDLNMTKNPLGFLDGKPVQV